MSFLRITSEGGLVPIVPRQCSIATARGNPPLRDDSDIGKDPNKSHTVNAKSCIIEEEEFYQFHSCQWRILFLSKISISRDSHCCIIIVWSVMMSLSREIHRREA